MFPFYETMWQPLRVSPDDMSFHFDAKLFDLDLAKERIHHYVSIVPLCTIEHELLIRMHILLLPRDDTHTWLATMTYSYICVKRTLRVHLFLVPF